MKIQLLTAGIKKEYWEYRNIFLRLPILIALLVTVFISGSFTFLEDYQSQRIIQTLSGISHSEDVGLLRIPMFLGIISLSFTFLIVAFIVQLYYATTCLFDERRDLSVHFWRSLPVSDFSALIVKVVTGSFLIPILYMLMATVTAVVLILIGLGAVALLSSSYEFSFLAVWQNIQFLDSVLTIWLCLIPYCLWILPICSWFMLASVIAKKAPFLWAVVPIVLLVLLEYSLVNFFQFPSFYITSAIVDYFDFYISQSSVSAPLEVGVVWSGAEVFLDKVNIYSMGLFCGLLFCTYWWRVNRN